MKFISIIGSALILFACQPATQKMELEEEPKVSAEFIEIEDAYHFYTIGDWGRNGYFHQKELAHMMDLAGYVVEPEFIVSTGDNFYPNGIASIQDPYWVSSFEHIYTGPNLFCPWNVVLGNHDYRGNPQAQVDYTEISQRWNMPSRYYYKDVEADDGATARFVFIDTTPLNDEYYEEAKYSNVHGQDTTAQLLWMDKVLNVDTDWKIVVGHHPLYTGGKRVDEKHWVRSHVETLLTKHNVQLYLAGHEHDLQHIRNEEMPTHHIISGSGSEVRKTGMMQHSIFAESIQGFVASSITKDSIYNQFVDYEGNVIYSHTIVGGE